MSNRLPPAHYNDLDEILPAAWSLLQRGVRDRRADFHLLQVATVTSEGLPSIRSVVLRGFDEQTRTMRFHTDSRAEKSNEIFERSQIVAHLYSREEKIQLRMLCRASLHHRNAVSSAGWRSMREMSRDCYRQTLAPGTRVDTPQDITVDANMDADEAYDNFAVVTATIQHLEWLYLAAAGHRRAVFDWRNGSETRTWLAP